MLDAFQIRAGQRLLGIPLLNPFRLDARFFLGGALEDEFCIFCSVNTWLKGITPKRLYLYTWMRPAFCCLKSSLPSGCRRVAVVW